MICLHIMEDVTPGTQRQRDREAPGGISAIAECAFMGQKYKMGVIYVTHTLSGTSPIIRENTETIIICSLPGENPRVICNTLGVTPEQAERVKTLRPGEFVILNPALWEKCVYATFEELQIPGKLDESTRKTVARNFLNNVKSNPPVPLSKFKKTTNNGDGDVSQDNTKSSVISGLSSEKVQTLVLIATGTPKPVNKLCKQIGLSRPQLRRITKRLESIGLIAPHRFSTGKVGGQLCFYEITEFGWQILKKKGVLRPKSLTGGGFEHNLAAKLIEQKGKLLGYSVQFEVDIQEVRIDVLWLDRKYGKRNLFNIGVSSEEYECKALLKIRELPIFQRSQVIMVARDSKFRDKMKKILKAKDQQGNILKQIQMKLIADFLT